MLLDPLWLGLRYGALATALAVVPGVVVAWLLARRHGTGSQALSAIVHLPLALPPAVLCYYLIAPRRFDWNVAVALSAVYTLPLFAAVARAGFEAIDIDSQNAARSLGASEWRVFWRITVPLAWHALLAAALAAFARAWADFGLTAIFAAPASGWASRMPALVVLGTAVCVVFFWMSRLRRGRTWV
jgi:molybdate transport system permease protein